MLKLSPEVAQKLRTKLNVSNDGKQVVTGDSSDKKLNAANPKNYVPAESRPPIKQYNFKCDGCGHRVTYYIADQYPNKLCDSCQASPYKRDPK